MPSARRIYNSASKAPKVKTHRSLGYGHPLSIPRTKMSTFDTLRHNHGHGQKHSSLFYDNSRTSAHLVKNLAAFKALSNSARIRADVEKLDDGVGSVGYWRDRGKKRIAYRKKYPYGKH
jgi:hypothetical protein